MTQLVLGAGVGAAVLGRHVGPRKAALVGGVLGTLPDLDVFYPFDNPVDAFVWHRAATHSLIVHAAATPVLGELVRFGFRQLREARWHAWAAVFLCLATHALLDAMTVYGTRIFWPLWPDPVGLGSIFIIDPLYTLPLLVVFVWALCLKGWTARFRAALVTALVLSTAYLGWSALAQRLVTQRAAATLAAAGVAPERLLATPTPFNTLLWRAIAIDGPRYLNLYLTVVGDRVAVYQHPRGNVACLEGNAAAAVLGDFAKGFLKVEDDGRQVLVADLRMGLTPNYVFRYLVAEHRDGLLRPVPAVRMQMPRSAPGDLPWLWATLAGSEAPRPAEAAWLVADLSPGIGAPLAC
ncbi:MAG: metal-dependent hydrolase [Alphaproteobacteria bacterium]